MSSTKPRMSSVRNAVCATVTAVAVMALGMPATKATPVITPDCSIDAGSTCRVVFNDASSLYTWQVPSWINVITLTITGGVGGESGVYLPAASRVIEPFYALYSTGDISVTPNSSIGIAIGAGGSAVAGGQNPLGDYNGGDALADFVGGGGAATVVDVAGQRYVVAGTAGASRRFLTHADGGLGSNGAGGYAYYAYSAPGGHDFLGGGGGGYVGGAAGRPGSSYLAGYARYSGMQYADTGSNGTVTIDYTAPETATAPVIDAVNTGDGSLSVDFHTSGSWAGPDADNYEYSLDFGNTWTAFSPAQTSSPLLISGLTNGVNYPVQIRAVNSAGAGDASATYSGTPFTTPAAPDVYATAGSDGAVSISFLAATNDGGSAITHYEYSTDGGSTWMVSSAPFGGPFDIEGLTVGQLYSVGVRAVNAAGVGAASSFSDVTPISGASSPSISSVTPGDGVLSVDFTAPVTDGASAITNYEFSIDGGVTWETRSPASTASPIVISGLSNGTSYGVALRAVNAGGLGVASASFSGTPFTVPSAAGIDEISSTAGALYVSVVQPSFDGGSAVTNFEYSTDDGGSWTAVSPAQTSGVVTIDGLTVGTTYSVKVRAVNAAGSGAASVAVDGTPITAANAPTVTGVTEGSGRVSIAFTAPSLDGASAITNYEYTTDGGTTWTAVSPTATASPVVVTGLTNGTTYSVGLRAVNGSGNGAVSSFTSATPYTTPGAPAVTGIEPGNGQATVSFNAPNSDGGSQITDYEYSADNGQSWHSAGLTSPAVVAGLSNGSSYVIEMRAINAAGAGNTASSDSLTPRTTPDAPVISSATSTDGVVHVSVTNPVFDGGAAITNFEYSLDSGVTWVALDPAVGAGLVTTSFDVANLTVGSTYGVLVRAVNVAGSGASSNSMSVKVITAASAPSIDSVTPGDSSLSVAFTAPSSDGSSAVTNYEYSTDGGSTWTTRSPAGTASPIVISGLSNGTSYDVTLRAVNGSGTSAASVSASGTPRTVPSAAGISNISSTSGKLFVSLTAPSFDGGSAVTNFEYSTDDGASWTAVSPAQTSGVVTIDGLTVGQSYAVKVRAVNAAGVGTASVAVTAMPITAADAPTITGVIEGSGRVSVDFTAPVSDGSSAITNYEYTVDGGASWTVMSPAASTSPLVITGLVNGTTYSVGLRAINAAGVSATSSFISVKPRRAPDAPQVTDVVPGDGQVTVSFSAPSFDGGSDLIGFEYSTDSGVTWVPTGLTSPVVVTGLSNGTAYVVKVRAVNTAGASSEASSASVTPRTTATAPIITSLSSTDGVVHVEVANPEFDGGAAITNFEYSTDNGDTWIALSPSEPAGLSTTIFDIEGLTVGQLYSVGVRAVNAAGVGAPSTFSEITVITGASAPSITTVTPAQQQLSIDFTEPLTDGGAPITNYQYSLNAGLTWTTVFPAQVAGPIVVDGLVNGSEYSLKLRAVTAGGTGQASSISTATPRTIPGAPIVTGVTSLNGGLHFSVTPPASNGGAVITGYEYSIDNGSTWEADANLADGVTVTGLTNGDPYSFKIRAVNAAGEGPASAPSSGTPATVPSAPTFATVLGSNGKIAFALNSSVDDGGATITGLQYRSTVAGSWTSATFVEIDSTYVVAGLVNGSIYPIQVRLVNSMGAGQAVSQDASPQPEVAAAPKLGEAIANNGTLTVSMSPPGDDGGSDITGYEYSVDGGSKWTTVSVLDGAFTISGLVNDTTYDVILRAVNAVGVSDASDPVSGTPLAAVPTVTTITSLTSVNHGLLVNFVEPSSDGGSAITSYEYSINAGTTWQDASIVVGSPTRLSITGLSNGYNYMVKIRAKNAVGAGPESQLMAGLVGTTSGRLGLTAVNAAIGAIDATFLTPSFAKFGAWANQWYQFSLDGGVTWSKSVRSSVTATLKTAGKAYLHIPSLVNGRTYSIAVRAMYTHKLNGVLTNAPGQASIVMNATPRTVASAPRITSVSTIARSLTIHFEAPTSNGGAAITNYAYSFGGSKWIVVSPMSVNSPITISGLDAGRTYTVRLRAINAAGQGAASGISAIVVKR